ncbi:AAA family ATPase [Winogradskyella sp. F6397]|uniref:AAA family ATPase n=1 Tax=Winogradskyella marina TaxID=2785530 RepID=A0ABS0EFN7_9FLAO|nr:AAA family ATPase [Winogradskyella marina]MBF8149073.1 AAA family ATPase [Winogradskyella marina]
MKIESVKIKNFFCYLDEIEFTFDKGLNIVSASNGGGKSQLFNAFYWVFFNQIYSNIGESTQKKKWKTVDDIVLCPDYYKVNSSDGDTIETIVEIKLLAPHFKPGYDKDSDDVNYTFRRSINYKKENESLKTWTNSGLQIEYNFHSETHFADKNELEGLLNNIFPSNLRKFMWYQGETMDELYDFSNNITLRKAIDGISYYPIYDSLHKVVEKSFENISQKIYREQKKGNKITREQDKIIDEIFEVQKQLKSKNESKLIYENDINDLEDKINTIEDKLSGFDHFIKFKSTLVDLESQLLQTKNEIDFIEHSTKDDLISKWMLNGCEEAILKSQNNLDKLNQFIQDMSETENPIPINLPGPEYIERMLKDSVCYICERPVEKDTEPYDALKKRMNDFEVNLKNRILSDNYQELNRAKRRITNELPKINDEIDIVEKKKKNLIKKRNSLAKKIDNLYTEIGSENRGQLDDGAHTASRLTNQLHTYNKEVKQKTRYLQDNINAISILEKNLKELNEKSDLFSKSDGKPASAEEKAKNYIKLFVDSIGLLKSKAYDKLITEIEIESNRLYSLYLGKKEQGTIVITKNGIRIADKKTDEFLSNLNAGEEVASNLAVANSFLSLSAKKMNKSYPLIADAPTSDLDYQNTYNLTVNISDSFEQMIIMSKDYVQFSNQQISELVAKANISNFYIVTNELINEDEDNSRTNKKSNVFNFSKK